MLPLSLFNVSSLIDRPRLDSAVSAVAQDVLSRYKFQDNSTPLWRNLIESTEDIFKHKLLRKPRTKLSGDAGEVFEGIDELGLPTGRSDLYFRYLSVLIDSMLPASESSNIKTWKLQIAKCLRAARKATLPPGCAELGWGRGRLLLISLLRYASALTPSCFSSESPLILSASSWQI